MDVNKVTTRILIIIIVLVLATMACVGGGNDNGGWSTGDGKRPDATATYGAHQLHIQLTAIAQEGQE